MLSGTEMLDGEGKKVIGTMPDNGAISSTMDGLETKSVSIPAGYTSGGTVALDSTIDNTANSQATQIDEIMELLEEKSAGDGGSGGSVETCTVRIVAGGPAPQYMDLERIVTATSTGAYYAEWGINEYTNFDITIPNALCKGIISISTGLGYKDMSYVTGVAITGGAEMLRGGAWDTLHLFEIDASANESITIEFECENDY